MAWPIPPLAASVPGALGAVVSETLATASFEAGPTLPAASAASTL